MTYRDCAQAIVNCLVRHLQAKRTALLEQVPSCGGPISEEERPLSVQLDQVDHALIGLGLRDTVERCGMLAGEEEGA